MDTITINNLKVPCSIGVLAWEKQVEQTLSITLEYQVDASHIAQKDDLNAAVDYAAISASIINFCQQQHWELLETLAERLCQLLLNEFDIPWLRLNIAKPSPVKHVEAVTISVTRGAVLA